ncbi:butyrophilin subfamily 1 member A1-like [Erpetoichthys calabaricus]|uniref:butyrophilin subfamily 1 member A1-like n=1 Tax=Erpetoichthys calabaricus TaxID=27687 RepID=UPI002234ADAA|nr:butyrophilin subfamily 1 member A1-like [Erpetoichthys calabaricus]
MKLQIGSEVFLLLLILRITFQQQAQFSLVGSNLPITSHVGGSVVLPCLLTSKTSAVDMEIKWLKNKDVVHSYVPLKSKETGSEERTALFKGELPFGNVSLLLKDLRVSDAGTYSCNVFGADWFVDTLVELKVTSLGNIPNLIISKQDNGQIIVECETEKWYPKPDLHWKTFKNTDLTGQSETSVTTVAGLFSISSSLPVSVQDRKGIACQIDFGEDKLTYQSRVQIPNEFFTFVQSQWKGWAIFFALCFISVLCILAVGVYFFRKNKANVENQKKELVDENQDLLKEIKSTGYTIKSEWERLRKAAAHVTLDPETAHPRLVVSTDGHRVRDQFKDQTVPDTPLRFDAWIFVLGRESFTSGQHYWEVDVKERSEWYLGVVSESAQRKGRVSLKPQSGYWIVRLYSDELTALTDPETTLRLRAIPQKVGVYLDCDERRLSFYSIEDHWHIYTFNGGVTGKLYPLFEPGVEGEELEILQPANETNNSDQLKEVV